MTGESTVDATCGACGAVNTALKTGAAFTCVVCGKEGMAESAAPDASKPIARPVAPPVRSKPPTAKLAADPVDTPRRKPVAAPTPESPSIVAPRRAHTRVMSAVRPDLSSKPAKSPLVRFGLPAAGVAVAGLCVFFALKSGSGPSDHGGPGGPPRNFDPAARSGELARAFPPTDAAGAWRLQAALDEAAERWSKDGAPSAAVEALRAEAKARRDETLKFDPDHAEARATRDEVKYRNEIEAFGTAPWLPEHERDALRKTHVGLIAASSNGWIPRATFDEKVKPLLDRHGKSAKDYEEMMDTPFGMAAEVMGMTTTKELEELFEGTAKFHAYIEKPYVLFVEKNASWDPIAAAKGCVDPLISLEATFHDQFSKFGVKRLDRPVPVLFFRTRQSYEDYGKRRGRPVGAGVEAYFEWDNGRLVLHDECDFTTRIHEGTHQLFFAQTIKPDETDLSFHMMKQSYWFQEGIAEWFGGSHRVNDGGVWRYEVGVLQPERLKFTLGQIPPEERFTLPQLLRLTYMSRMILPPQKHLLTYAQGWLLIYFCNHFNVDDAGRVVIGKPGKYAAGFEKYLQAELDGRTGKQVFMDSLGLNEEGLKAMGKEFSAYTDWILRKVALNHVKDKRILAWDEYVNRRGEKTGEAEADLLYPPERKADAEEDR